MSETVLMFIYSIGCGSDMSGCDSDDEYWIGLVKYGGNLNSKEGWQWLDGTEYEWQNWLPGDPNGDHGVARMINTGEWGDQAKGKLFKYICRRNQLEPGIIS